MVLTLLRNYALFFDIKKKTKKPCTALQLGMWDNIGFFLLTARLGSLWVSRANALLFLVCIYSSLNALFFPLILEVLNSTCTWINATLTWWWVRKRLGCSPLSYLSLPPSLGPTLHIAAETLFRNSFMPQWYKSYSTLQVCQITSWSYVRQKHIFWYLIRLITLVRIEE